MSKHYGRKIVILSHLIRRNVDRVTEISGISGPQSKMLHYIAVNSKKQDVFQRDLENEFHIRRSSIHSLIQHLEEVGLIRRVSIETDARLKKLVMTEKGWDIVDKIGIEIERFERRIEEVLSDDAEQFSCLMDQLIEELTLLETEEKGGLK